MRLNSPLVVFAEILLGLMVTPFTCLENAHCGNSQVQSTVIVNGVFVLSPPSVDIDVIDDTDVAGTLFGERRALHHTNLGMEDALHRKPYKAPQLQRNRHWARQQCRDEVE